MSTQNIIFDIGNVFIRWTPLENLRRCFPNETPEPLWQSIRPSWRDLNRGKMTLEEALDLFHATTKLPKDGFRLFCDLVAEQAIFLPDSITLLRKLKAASLPLYYLSDNVREFVASYREMPSSFLSHFDGGVVSGDIGFLKPEPQMYQCLLACYDLDPASCVFFDDLLQNVEGARQVGMNAFVFTDAAACEKDLKELGFVF